MVDNRVFSATTGNLALNANPKDFFTDVLNLFFATNIGQTTSTGSVLTIPGASTGLAGSLNGGSTTSNGGLGSSNPSRGFSSSSGFAGYDSTNPAPVDFSASTNGNDRRQYIRKFDTDRNGALSREEILDYFVKSRKNSTPLDNDVFLANDESADIYKVLNNIDTAADGTITDAEAALALFKIRNPTNHNTLNPEFSLFVLNRLNNNTSQIQAKLDKLDLDKNGKISNVEVLNSLMLSKTNQMNLNDPGIEPILRTNSKYQDLLAISNDFGLNPNIVPSNQDVLSILLKLRAGNGFSQEEMQKILFIANNSKAQSIENSLDIFDSNKNGEITLREYTQAIINIKKGTVVNPGDDIINEITDYVTDAAIVKNLLNIIDTDNNGTITGIEFATNFSKAIMGPDGKTDLKKLGILSSLKDIIYPSFADIDNFKNAVDIDHDNVLSDNELIDALLKINGGTLQTPAADIVDLIFSANPNKTQIIRLVSAIDQNKNGAISNIELTNILMKVRKGEFAQEDLGLTQAILHKNSNFNSVQSLVDLFDKDQNGTVADLELFDALFKIKGNRYQGEIFSDVVNSLKASNPNAAAIETLVNGLDPNNNGIVDYDELVQAFLRINAGSLTLSDEVKRAIPSAIGAYGDKALSAEQLVDLADNNSDGQISDIEIGNMIIANKKTHNLNAFDPNFVSAVFRTNPNTGKIETLINSIDKDGDGNFSDMEIVQALLSQRRDPNTFGNDFALVQTILSANSSSYAHINNLMSSVDADNNGNVSNIEVMKTLINGGKNLISATDRPLVDEIIHSNINADAIITAYNNFGINPNSLTLTNDLFSTWIAIQQGTKPSEYFNDLVNVLAKGPELAALTTKFAAIDTDHNGRINTTEYGDFLVQMRANHQISSSDQELANFLANADPELNKIQSLITSFDPEGNGIYSDQGILNGLINLRKLNDKTLSKDTQFVKTILHSNSNTNEIEKVLNLVDPNRVGNLTNNSVIPVWQNIQGGFGVSNPAYDFNGNGTIDYGDMATVYSLLQVANNRQDIKFMIYDPSTPWNFVDLFFKKPN